MSQSFAALLVLLALSSSNVSAADPAAKSDEGLNKIVYREDMLYGRVHGAALLADVAWPAGTELRPAIISVHGGRWIAGDKKHSSSIKVKQWAGFGYFAMSIDYRLKGCTPPPACYQDLQCAIRYVHAHAKEHHIDTNRIYLIGQSVGGHLVSLAATRGDATFPRTGGWDKASNDFRAAISVAAAYDLPSLDWGALWTPTGVDPQVARAEASPNRYITKQTKPLLIMHSDNDHSVPIANALLMVEALRKAGATHTFHRYPTMGHMDINAEVIARTREFIEAQSTTTAPGK